MVFRNIPCLGLWSTDFLTGETSWSNEMFVIYGLKPGSLTPSVEMLMKYTHPDDQDNVSNGIHRATKMLKPFSFFYRIVRKDKSVRSLYSAGSIELNDDGKPVGRYGVCFNLTGLTAEDKQAVEKKLFDFEMPGRDALISLDEQNSQIKVLQEIASIVAGRAEVRHTGMR